MAEEWKANGKSNQMIEIIPHIIYTFFINQSMIRESGYENEKRIG